MFPTTQLARVALRSKISGLAALRSRGLSAVADARSVAAKRELAALAEAFQRYDGDASGALDRGELTKALADLDIPDDEIFVDSLFVLAALAALIGRPAISGATPLPERIRLLSDFQQGQAYG